MSNLIMFGKMNGKTHTAINAIWVLQVWLTGTMLRLNLGVCSVFQTSEFNFANISSLLSKTLRNTQNKEVEHFSEKWRK